MSFDEDLEEFNRLWPFVQQFQRLAAAHDIDDVFQDNGGKLLQALLALRLRKLEGREGHDAVDVHGKEYELKSINIAKGKSRGCTTHHHMTLDIIEHYRSVDWIIALYDGIEIVEVFRLGRKQMEPYYAAWAEKLRAENKDHLNNPKIPMKHIREQGALIYVPRKDGQGLLH